ncbi:polysaccharide deacetylase [Paramesorhizobium deserti]|uniref:Polysaccharide deacetylase n=1 Tax=Paramesorhizobium deserti TaxID=1494590 RepID=A0A135HP23_9HYPH|nr:polysaccharide deacetylase family protein [Paramesorhizobium deserti]KXF74920.1 polysaccharide deacetylase [Paramesorhizobium deserti]
MIGGWQLLHDELDRWSDAGRVADFWLRDDDAAEPTAALDRLLDLTGDYAVPVTLAVVPAFTGEALAARLARAQHALVAVHGWAHENHASGSEKKQELGPHRPRDVVLEELARGLGVITKLHGARVIPMLVPPWNRIDIGLVPELGRLGFEALSVFGPPKPAPIRLVNSNIDVMDWHGTRGCRDHAVLVGEIVAQLKRAFAGGDPVGLLTHHLVHDEAVCSFMERLFEVTSRNGVRWRSPREILAGLPRP